MNDKKTDWILFLLFIILSLLLAFLGKIVANYFGINSGWGILIGFFIPAGIIAIWPITIPDIKDLLGTILLICGLLIVPTMGLSIIFLPFIIILIFILVVSIKGFKSMPEFLINFFSAQFMPYKEKVKTEVDEYIKSESLTMALSTGMPDKLEYKVIWLRKKIYYLQQKLRRGPERSLRTWHGPYGWQYESTILDKHKHAECSLELKKLKEELHNLEIQKSDSNKDEWYWNETF